MAYIAKLGDKWRAQVAKRGVRKTAVWDTKREAVEWAAKVEAEIAGGKHRAPTMTLRSACNHYLKTVSIHKRDAEAWESRRFDAICSYFGDDRPLSEIDSDQLGKWRDFRLKGDVDHPPVSGSTVLREVNLYRNLFKLAYEEWKWISEYPFKGVRLPKENQAREAIWRAMPNWRILHEGKRRGGKTYEVTQAFHIALRTAMRLQEALAAPAGFDKNRRVVIIPPSKTNPRPETIPLTKEGYRLMLKMPKFTVDPNEASVLFSALCKSLMIKGLQFRDSRATALTFMSRRMDILTLARISRHRDIQLLSDVYYRETPDEISARL
jgi:hypothetical protein